ncbi:hypothetical protein ACFL57_03705 [Candidatus Margulisiibacteriota bacterium]
MIRGKGDEPQMLNMELRDQQAAFENDTFAAVMNHAKQVRTLHEQQIHEFVTRLSGLLPNVGSNEEKIIQMEVMAALSVEGIITVENIAERAEMVKAITEMIRYDAEKRETAVAIARKILK